MLLMSLVVLFMAGGHLLDIGGIGQSIMFTNGFFTVDAVKVQHVGYYMMFISFMILAALHVIIVTGDE